jgi:chromosome segregation ATPase
MKLVENARKLKEALDAIKNTKSYKAANELEQTFWIIKDSRFKQEVNNFFSNEYFSINEKVANFSDDAMFAFKEKSFKYEMLTCVFLNELDFESIAVSAELGRTKTLNTLKDKLAEIKESYFAKTYNPLELRILSKEERNEIRKVFLEIYDIFIKSLDLAIKSKLFDEKFYFEASNVEIFDAAKSYEEQKNIVAEKKTPLASEVAAAAADAAATNWSSMQGNFDPEDALKSLNAKPSNDQQKKVAELVIKNNNLTKEIADLVKKNKSHKKALGDKQKESNNKSEEIKKLKSENENLREKESELSKDYRQKIQKYENEILKLGQEQEKIGVSIAYFEGENKELNRENAELKKEINRFLISDDLLKKENSGLRQNVENSFGKYENLEKEFQKLHQENEGLKAKILQQTNGFLDKLKENNDLNFKLKEGETEKNYLKEIIASKEQIIFEKEQQLNNFVQENYFLEDELKKFQDFRSLQEGRKNFFNSSLDEKSLEIEKLKKEIEDKNKLIYGPRKHIANYRLKFKKSSIWGLQKEIQEIKEEFDKISKGQGEKHLRNNINIALRCDDLIKLYEPLDITDSHIGESNVYKERDYAPWYDLIKVGLLANKACVAEKFEEEVDFHKDKNERIERLKESFKLVKQNCNGEKYQPLNAEVNDLLETRAQPSNSFGSRAQGRNNRQRLLGSINEIG